MRFSNARQCIHDAFATNLTTPDRMEAGGTKFNSNNAIAHQAEAGKIIRAVVEQKPHLRGICMFLNAPNGCTTGKEIGAMKSRAFQDLVKKGDMSPRVIGEMCAIFDHLLINFRRRIHNPANGDEFTTLDIATILHRSLESYTEEVEAYEERLLNILKRFDNQSLQPVWHVVNAEREKRQKEFDEKGAINPRTGKPYKTEFPKEEAVA